MTIVKRIDAGTPVERQGCIGLVAGTSVRTPCGPRRVENLRPGDLIVTRDNGLQAVRVVFSRTVSAAEIAADPALAPIRLEPRAIAPMMPSRPVLVGGEHRLLIPGWRLEGRDDRECVLVPARDLADRGDAIRTVRDARDTTYVNLVFDAHEVFAADGLPAESFRPVEDAMGDLAPAVRDDIHRIFAGWRDRAAAPAGYDMPDHVELCG